MRTQINNELNLIKIREIIVSQYLCFVVTTARLQLAKYKNIKYRKFILCNRIGLPKLKMYFFQVQYRMKLIF